MAVCFRKLCFTILIAAFAASSVSFAPAEKKPGDSHALKIGFSLDSLKVERWQTDLDEFQKRAQELGAEVLVETAEGDDDLQFQQAQKLVDSGIKVLVLVPHNTDSASRIVNVAKAKHVRVVCYDRLVRNSDVDLFVGFDTYGIGVLQAGLLTERAPKGNYVLIGGSPTDNNAKLLHAGQMGMLQPLVDRGDIKIVADTWTLNWDPTEAYVHMTQAIDANAGNIVAVVASNDGTAGGAIQALEEHKLAGKVFVSGQDADLASIVRILEGSQTMTVYKPIAREAKQAAEAAVTLAKGEDLKITRSIPNGTKEVPAILLDSITVTKDNVKETVIKDGFQKPELIKQGLPKELWALVE